MWSPALQLWKPLNDQPRSKPLFQPKASFLLSCWLWLWSVLGIFSLIWLSLEKKKKHHFLLVLRCIAVFANFWQTGGKLLIWLCRFYCQLIYVFWGILGFAGSFLCSTFGFTAPGSRRSTSYQGVTDPGAFEVLGRQESTGTRNQSLGSLTTVPHCQQWEISQITLKNLTM